MRGITTRGLAVTAGLGLALACGGDDPVASSEHGDAGAPLASSASASGGRAPVIRSVSLIPNPPESGGVMRAVVTASDPDGPAPGLQFEWTVRGRPLASKGPTVDLPKLRKGDRIAVRVVAHDGTHESDPATAEALVANARPRILDLRVSKERRDDVEHWVVEPMADDPDGDVLDYEYTWRVNGRDSDVREAAFSVDALRRGDRLTVRVVADDGEDRSDPVESAPLEIANSAPEITSRPRGLDRNGEFHYAIEATDADGDRGLRYELVEGPDGMTLDESSGQMDWAPTVEQAGEHRVEIAVHDRNGGSSQQVFILPVVTREVTEETPPAAAAR